MLEAVAAMQHILQQMLMSERKGYTVEKGKQMMLDIPSCLSLLSQVLSHYVIWSVYLLYGGTIEHL